MKSDIQNYVKLQTALINEKAKIEARLSDINRVLGGDVVVTATPTAKQGGRRTFSAATKAKMAAAQKARWAAKKSGVAAMAGAAETTKQPGRKLSEATKAKMRAAHQARWAKKKGKTAAPTTATSSAPAPKKKRKMSAAGKANIRAAVKARWAKVNAQKKGE